MSQPLTTGGHHIGLVVPDYPVRLVPDGTTQTTPWQVEDPALTT